MGWSVEGRGVLEDDVCASEKCQAWSTSINRSIITCITAITYILATPLNYGAIFRSQRYET
jgi:hypothetical protein